MNKLQITISVALVCYASLVLSQSPTTSMSTGIPVSQLSPDNPNHKHIIKWFDNYKQRTGSQNAGDYLIRDRSGDIVSTGSAERGTSATEAKTSIDDVIKLAFSQPVQSSADNQGRSQTTGSNVNHNIVGINRHNYGKQLVSSMVPETELYMPYAFTTGDNKNQAIGGVSRGSGDKQPNIEVLIGGPDGQLSTTDGQKSRKQDPFLQNYFKSMQGDNENDHHLLVEVSGDGKSILDQIKPLLRDKSVLEKLRGTHLDHTTSLVRQQVPDTRAHTQTMSHNSGSIVSSQPRHTLQDQNGNRIHELRQSLDEHQARQLATQLKATSATTSDNEGQMSLGQFLTGYQGQSPLAKALVPSGQPHRQPILLLEQRDRPTRDDYVEMDHQLVNKLQALALKPLIDQQHSTLMPSGIRPVPPNHREGAVTPIPVQTVPQSQTPPLVVAKGADLQVPTYKEISAQQSYMAHNYGHQQHRDAEPVTYVGAGSLLDKNGKLRQQHLVMGTGAIGKQSQGISHQQFAHRQQQIDDNKGYEVSGRVVQEADSFRKAQLREELLRGLEEQERKRQELMEVDRQHRQMLDEARRRQEALDQQDAYRLANEKLVERERQWQTPGAEKAQGGTGAGQGADTTAQYSSQEWPQSLIIRNQMVDNDRVGPTGPVDVLHSIHTIDVTTEAPVAQSTAIGNGVTPGFNIQYYTQSAPAGVQQSSGESQPTRQVRLRQQGSAPVVVSAEALAQAERVDAAYIKRLREILAQNGMQVPTGEPTVVHVPVEAPPTLRMAARGPVMATTEGAVSSNGGDDWWRSNRIQTVRQTAGAVTASGQTS